MRERGKYARSRLIRAGVREKRRRDGERQNTRRSEGPLSYEETQQDLRHYREQEKERDSGQKESDQRRAFRTEKLNAGVSRRPKCTSQ